MSGRPVGVSERVGNGVIREDARAEAAVQRRFALRALLFVLAQRLADAFVAEMGMSIKCSDRFAEVCRNSGTAL